MKRVPMMPVRDMVIFPEMMHPFIVGREASVRALEEALAGRQEDFSGHAARRLHRRSQARGDLSGRHARQYRAERQAARRQYQGAGRRHRARQNRPDHQRRRLLPRFGEAGSGEDRAFAASGAGVQPRDQSLRAVRQAFADSELRHDDRRRARGRSRKAFRRDRREPADSRGRKAGTARDFRAHRAPEPHRRHSRSGNREAERRPLHQHAREAPDGTRPERVLPQREAQGHPEGTRARRSQRNRAAQEEDRNLRHARRSDGKGHAGAQAPRNDAADVGRIHRVAELSGLAAGGALEEALEGTARHQARRGDSLRGPLRPGKDQRAHSRISRRAPAGEESQRLDSLLPRASGCGQDFACHIDRPRHGAQVRARFARRRARRGGNSRPPPHLYRRPARPDHPDDAQGRHHQSGVRAGRSGQDVHGLPRRSVRGADGSARSGAQPLVHRSLSRRRIRSLEGDVHLHRQRAAHDSAAAAGSHGSAAHPGLHGAGKAPDRAALSGSQAARSHRLDRREPEVYRRGPDAHHPALHP